MTEKSRRKTLFPKSPEYYARLFQKDGLYGGHIIMLGKGNEEAVFRALAAFPRAFKSGGITPDNALFYLSKGASHVIVTSYIFRDGRLDFERLKEMVDLVGKDRLVLDLSCRKKESCYYVVTDRWQRFTDFELSEQNIRLLEKYCSEFWSTAWMWKERSLASTKTLPFFWLAAQGFRLPTPAGFPAFGPGGVRTAGKGKINATIGSALDIFGGPMSYEETVRWFMKRKVSIDLHS